MSSALLLLKRELRADHPYVKWKPGSKILAGSKMAKLLTSEAAKQERTREAKMTNFCGGGQRPNGSIPFVRPQSLKANYRQLNQQLRNTHVLQSVPH